MVGDGHRLVVVLVVLAALQAAAIALLATLEPRVTVTPEGRRAYAVGLVVVGVAVAELPPSDDARAVLARFRADNPRGKHGQVAYDLRADFGLEPKAVRARFGFYCERFGVRANT